MNGYESRIFKNFGADELTNSFQRLLGVGTHTDLVLTRQQGEVPPVESSRICSLISAYRLLDVLAILNGGHSAPLVERQPYEIPASFRVRTYFSARFVHTKLFTGNGQNGQLAKGFDPIPDYAEHLRANTSSVIIAKRLHPIAPHAYDFTQPLNPEVYRNRGKFPLCSCAYCMYEGAPVSQRHLS
jgi:hypothetical protein